MGPVIGVVAAVAGAAASVYGTVQSTKAQKKSVAAQRAQQTLQERRSRRQSIRETQIRRAQALSTAQAAGALNSSGAAGGIGSLTSQLGAEFGFQSQFGALSDIVTTQNQKAVNAQALGSFGGSLLSFGISRGALDNLKLPQAAPNRPPSGPSTFGGLNSRQNGGF